MKAASSKLAPAFNTATAANVAPAFNATAKGVAPAFNGVAPALSNSLGVASLPSATYNLKTLQNKQVYKENVLHEEGEVIGVWKETSRQTAKTPAGVPGVTAAAGTLTPKVSLPNLACS